MEIIVKVTDAELSANDLTEHCVAVVAENFFEQNYSVVCKAEVINTDDAKRAIKTTKDKHMAIINNKHEG